MSFIDRRLVMPLLIAATLSGASAAYADREDFGYKQTNLVSDGAVPALKMDAHLKNPWGVAAIPGAPFWVADNGAGVSTLYDGLGDSAGLGDIVPLTVTIPTPKGASAGSAATPTGIVWNPNGQKFLVAPKLAALFIFATEDGTLSAWNPAVNVTNAILEVDNSEGGNGAVYKGLALATNSAGIFLYATNFRAGTVDVFDSSFKPATLSGSFSDPHLPPGYAPFGIALIDGNLYVTYALQDAAKHDDQKGPGRGFVDVFDTDGHLISRFASRGRLNSPWGIARAPANFGSFSSSILIGNFGDGHINAFSSFGDFRGQLRDPSGHPIGIDGLWSLVFGTASAATPSKLYFSAGTNDEADGLFGSLETIVVKDHDHDHDDR